MSQRESRLDLMRRHCAERRRHLAELERLAERLVADAQRLIASSPVRAQPAALATGPRAGFTERRSKLECSLADVVGRIARARAAVAAAEQQLDLHERASAQRIHRRRG